jgi:phosphoribosyl-ATP pyrophosphohydrolase/phosphoribosyl-AMP cyclohydrolase
LFVRGVDRIGKKVGEEAVELVIAAKNEEKVGVINEAADLLYHMMVLLNVKDVKISEVCAELCKRNR